MDSTDRAIDRLKKRRAAVKEKIHPALPEIFSEFRAAERAWKILKQSDRTPERLGEIQRQLDEKLGSIEHRYSGPVQAPPGTFGVEAVFTKQTMTSQSESAAVAEYLHWNRHKTPLEQDVHEMQSKDYAASTRVQRTLQDYEVLRCDQGPVKPFKGGQDGTDHWDFLVMGWGLGLQNLSPEELADFADNYCLCGRKDHNPDNLKQQRLRVKKALERR
jgi:uncharacterized protein YdcH (DUF465 family)